MFSVNFLANQYVSDEDINAIGYNLSNTVYTAFTNDTSYGVDALNEITAHMMNKGIKRNYKNECALSLVDTNIHIDSGLAFFENGATITIDDDGIDLTLEDSTETQYVYLFFNGTINVGGARCTVEYPGGDFVLLGSITNGVLKQDRTFAYLNTDVKGTNEVVTLTLEPTIVTLYDEDFDYKVMRYRTGINVTGYAKANYRTPEDEIVTGSYKDIGFVVGSYDIQNNTCLVFCAYSDNGYMDYGTGNYSYIKSKMYIEDGELVIDVYFNHDKTCYYKGKKLKVDLYGGAEE